MPFLLNLNLSSLILIDVLQFFLFTHKMIIILLIDLVFLGLKLVSHFDSIIKLNLFSFSLQFLLISFLLSDAKLLLNLFPLLFNELLFPLLLER